MKKMVKLSLTIPKVEYGLGCSATTNAAVYNLIENLEFLVCYLSFLLKLVEQYISTQVTCL